MPISCHFLDCKALLVANLTHIISTIRSVQTFIRHKNFINDRSLVLNSSDSSALVPGGEVKFFCSFLTYVTYC